MTSEERYISEIEQGKKISSENLFNLIKYFEIVDEKKNYEYGKVNKTAIVKLCGRYFKLDYEIFLDKEWFGKQPVEVYPREVTRLVTETVYETEIGPQQLVPLEDNNLTVGFKDNIIRLEKAKKEIEEEYNKAKETLLKAMGEKNIIKLETNEISVNYVAPSYRESFDSIQFKQENEELYNKYVKISPVKPSIRIKVK